MSDVDHPIKLPSLFWDDNGEEFALHSHAPWHVPPSQGEEPDVTSLQMTCAADSSLLLSIPTSVGLEVPLLVLAAAGKILLTLKGKSGFYPDLASHGRGQRESGRDSLQWIIAC